MIDVSVWMNLRKIMLNERNRKCHVGTSWAVQWLGLHAPNVGDQGSIPGHKGRCNVPRWRLETQCDATKMQCSQINKYFLKRNMHSCLPYAGPQHARAAFPVLTFRCRRDIMNWTELQQKSKILGWGWMSGWGWEIEKGDYRIAESRPTAYHLQNQIYKHW